MANLSDDDIADFVQGTLRDLGRAKFSQIAQSLQNYEMMGKWLKKDKVTFDGGRGIQRQLMTKIADTAAHKGLYEQDQVNVEDLMSQIVVPYRHATNFWAYETSEMLQNKGDARVTDVIEPRRKSCMIGLADELEDKAWAAPASGNNVDPYGVPYYVVKNATTGFNGGAPSGHTTVAGINPTTTSVWKNYTYQYTAVTKADLIKAMRKGHRQTAWKSPVDLNEYRTQTDLRYYTNESVVASLEDIGEASNENLGRDLAPYSTTSHDVKEMDGFLTFRKHPIIYVPKLDEDTQNPIYQIDHGSFGVVVLKGDYLRETDPQKKADAHRVWVCFVDLSYNFICVDRRRHGVYNTA